MTKTSEPIIDKDGSGSDNFFMILKSAVNFPGVHVDRKDFLKKELSKKIDADKVELAINKNPASAGIKSGDLDKIANSCINFETTKVTALSAAAGLPGGLAMAGTVPADVAQYFAHIIRLLQKLIYLYGWQDIFDNNGELDDDTNNQLTLFIGIMFGVNAANAAITNLAKLTAKQMEKTLVNKALTKGTIYPVVKKVSSILGVKMTKQIFAKQAGKVIPILGAVLSGGLTLATFKPLGVRLKKHLVLLPTADVNEYDEVLVSN